VVRHFRLRAIGATTTAVAVTVLTAAACSSSTSSGGSTGPTASSTSGPNAPTGGNQALNPGTGSPKYGGTLNEVGVSDVQYMDYDTAYYVNDERRSLVEDMRAAADWCEKELSALELQVPEIKLPGDEIEN